MCRPERDHSVHREPHLQDASYSPDPSEERSAEMLARERASSDADAERARHSVFDEPGTLPNRPPAIIEQDWHCRSCGYNLRGLESDCCPECGDRLALRVSLAEPRPAPYITTLVGCSLGLGASGCHPPLS